MLRQDTVRAERRICIVLRITFRARSAARIVHYVSGLTVLDGGSLPARMNTSKAALVSRQVRFAV